MFHTRYLICFSQEPYEVGIFIIPNILTSKSVLREESHLVTQQLAQPVWDLTSGRVTVWTSAGQQKCNPSHTYNCKLSTFNLKKGELTSKNIFCLT